jgi:hypothetical protein
VIRKAVAGLAGLGLIGGVGSVAYKHGDAMVKIKDASGQVHTVVIGGDGGRQYSCPSATDNRLEPIDIRAGRIKLTLQAVRRSEQAIERRYPGHIAPHAVVVRFNALARRDDRLVTAYNAQIDEHNAVLDRDCKSH